jgi:hypothetical protein
VGFLFWGWEIFKINFACQAGGKEKAASEGSFGRISWIGIASTATET